MSEAKQETVADIVAEMRRVAESRTYGSGLGDVDDALFAIPIGDYADRIEEAYNRLPIFTPEQLTAIAQQGGEIADLKRENARLRAALAKITAVVTRHYASRNLGEQGRKAVSEIRSACNFPDGALDEYERSFEERDRLRAALKPVLECDALSTLRCQEAVREAQRIYNESEVKE